MILIKAGGGLGIRWDYIAADIAEIQKKEAVIVVHGASARRDEIAKTLGMPTKTIISPSGVSSVLTDEDAIDVFLMVYAGLANKKIVAELQKNSVNAIGLSGVDGRLWQAKQKPAVYSVENGKTKLITNNLTGRVESVNKDLLELLISNKYVPVLCPPAISEDGQILNTDNDFACALIAAAMNIKKMVVLFEEKGLLANFADKNSIVGRVNKSGLDNYMTSAQGRMKKKLLGAKKALELGVETIYWSDGRIENPISKALNGLGTIIS